MTSPKFEETLTVKRELYRILLSVAFAVAAWLAFVSVAQTQTNKPRAELAAMAANRTSAWEHRPAIELAGITLDLTDAMRLEIYRTKNALADLQWQVALAEPDELREGHGGGIQCPAGVANCQCGCQAGGVCTCTSGHWESRAGDGGDYGWYEAGVLKGRWFAKTGHYYTFDGKEYSKTFVVIAPRETAPPPRFPVLSGVFGGCPGGCCGGSCGRR
jgi:hypothetical protein